MSCSSKSRPAKMGVPMVLKSPLDPVEKWVESRLAIFTFGPDTVVCA